MPKDVFGRQTNVKKAEKAANKMNKTGSARIYKKTVKAKIRDMGYSRGLDKAENKMGINGRPSLDQEGSRPRTVAETAAKNTAQRVNRNKTAVKPNPDDFFTRKKLEDFPERKQARDTHEAEWNDFRANNRGMSARTVTRLVKKGEKKATKSANKVYKSELKKAKTSAAIKKAAR